MEPVTFKENAKRGISAKSLKTHCVNGHPFNEENTRFSASPNGRQRRTCRVCKREDTRKMRARAKRKSRARVSDLTTVTDRVVCAICLIWVAVLIGYVFYNLGLWVAGRPS